MEKNLTDTETGNRRGWSVWPQKKLDHGDQIERRRKVEFGEDVDLRPALAALKAWCVGDATGWTVVLDDQAPLVAAGLAEIAALWERENVRRQVWQEASDDAVPRGFGAPVAADKGHEVAREAVADFERRNPEPVFAEPDSRVQGWLKRVKAGTR